MTGSKSRKRMTVIASLEGVDRAEKALTRLGFESKIDFAAAQLLARTAVTKFFKRQPVELGTLKRVCEGLKLDWREILDSESETDAGQRLEAGQPEVVEMGAIATSQNLGITSAIARQITVRDHQRVVKNVIVLRGDIDSIEANFKSTLEVILKCYGGDTIEVIDLQAGSIRITIQGSAQDVERLRAQIASGNLTQVSDFPIEAIEILSEESLEASETPNSPNKWELVRAIKAQPQADRQLRDTDLSDVDLRGADLRGADLRGADLRGADLSDVDLRGADLSDVDLRGADLRGADLSNSTARDRDLARALDRDLARALDLARDLARDLDRDRALDLARALARALDLARDLARALARARALDLDLARALDRDLARALARALDRDLDRDLDLARALDRDLARARDRARDLALYRDRYRVFADFSGADFSGADFSGANFSGANFSGANFSGAFVKNARFGQGIGLSESEKRDLERRGAIFDDSVGDREAAYSRSPIKG